MTEIVACSKVITLHSLESRQPVSSYTHHRGNINCLNINHTNKVIASCGQDGKIFLVTADKPQSKLLENNFYPNSSVKPSALNACAFSPNSKFMAVGSMDSLVKVWDLRGQNHPQKEQSIVQIKSHMMGVTSLAWIRNLKAELFGSDILASSSSSGDIYMHSNKGGSFQEVMALKMQEGINCIRVSESMEYCRMAACTNVGTLAVWDLMSGKEKPVWQTSSPSQSKASMTSLSISAYSPVLLVTSSLDQTLTFFDIQERKSVKKITAEEPLSCVGLHANGHTLVAGGMYGNCFVYDLRNPSKPQNKLAGHETTIKHLEFFKAKEKEHSHGGTGQNKSKPPSIVNVNNSSSSQAVVENKPQSVSHSFPGQPETKSKQNIKVPEAKMNNFMGVASQKTALTEEPPRQKKIEAKLSTTGQEMMKNNTIRSEVIAGFSQTSGSQNFKHRGKELIRHQSMRHESSSLQPPIREGEARQLKQKVGQLHNELKQVHTDMFDMQQRINLSIIRQFQLHQSQIKSLLQSLLSKDKQKDETIRRLQTENNRLKNSTF